nr:nucleoprotein [Culex phenuivirus 1]
MSVSKDLEVSKTREELISILRTTETLSFQDNDLDKFRKSILYTGFDHKIILDSFTKKKPILTHSKDIACFIILLLERGTKVGKMIRKMSPDGKVNVRNLIDNYNVKERPFDNQTLTIMRICSLSPITACNYCANTSNAKHKGNSADPEIHDQMCNNMFSAVIPRDCPFKLEIIKAYLTWFIFFTNEISKKKRNMRKVLKLNLPFIKISNENSNITEEKRMEMMIKWGILVKLDHKDPDKIECSSRIVNAAAEFDKSKIVIAPNFTMVGLNAEDSD